MVLPHGRRAVLFCLAGLLSALPGLSQATPQSSTSQNPTVTFSSPGDYDVTLRACNAAGCRDVTKKVTVLDPMPKITSLTVPARVGADLVVPLQATTSGRPSLAHKWIFTKGQSTVELPGNPLNWNALAAGVGTYQVRLQVTNVDGSVTSDPVTVQVVPHSFFDVPIDHWAWSFIEALVARGVTSGCSLGTFCPDDPVTRGQMAVYLLRAKEGPLYFPPPCTAQQFDDVPCLAPFAPWINELVARGITAGCGAGNFCSRNVVTRAQMSVFLTRVFNLPTP